MTEAIRLAAIEAARGLNIPAGAIDGPEVIASVILAAVEPLIRADERENGTGADRAPDATPEGQWMRIAFMGHNELIGYVTETTIGGQPGFHVDLPDKVWGGNPLAWEEYAASALYSRCPLRAESVRAHWDAERERAAARARQEAEWSARALPAVVPPGDVWEGAPF